LLANVSDFDIAKHAVGTDQLLEVDRYAIALTEQMQNEVTQLYQGYEFHPAIARLQTFCSEDLGAFYLDILKDRLYTTKPDSVARRSAQTALWHVTNSLLRLMAPVLSFTAEEAWPLFAPDLHQTYAVLPTMPDGPALLAKWQGLRSVRAEVLRQLESLRTDGKIGSSLQAEVTVRASGQTHDTMASLAEDLRFLFITSGATLTQVTQGDALHIEATASTHVKCDRCWHYRSDVGQKTDHPSLCVRCHDNLFGTGETRQFA
jgi:isoleucyl-tRNA synthetase